MQATPSLSVHSLSYVPYTVYALVDPLDGVIRYIGITNNLPRRICEHLSLRGSNLLLKAWIAALAVKGYIPVVKVMDICPRREIAALKEACYIAANSETVYNLAA